MRLFIIVWFMLRLASTAHSQPVGRYNVFSFNVNEGLLQSHVNDIAFDELNIAWLSFNNGLQRFDGNSFYQVSVQDGLPDDKDIHFQETSNGALLLSHREGISEYLPQTNTFRKIFSLDKPYSFPAMFFGRDAGIIYFMSPAGKLIGIDELSYKKVYEAFISGSALFADQHRTKFLHSNILNNRIAFFMDSSIVVWDIPSKQKIAIVPAGSHRIYFSIWLQGKSELVYKKISQSNSVISNNFQTGEERLVEVFKRDLPSGSRGGIVNVGPDIFAFSGNQLFELSRNLTLARRIVSFSEETPVGNTAIDVVKSDRLGNLYLLTINQGFRKLVRNNYPVKYYGSAGIGSLFTVGLCIDKGANRILTGVQANGLIIYDTLQQLVKHIKFLPGKKESFTPSNIIRLQSGNYLLFNQGEKNAWELSADLSAFNIRKYFNVPANATVGNEYYTNNFNDRNGKVWVVSNYQSVSIKNGDIEYSPYKKYYYSATTSIAGWLIGAQEDAIVFNDLNTLGRGKQLPIRNTGGVRCIASEGDAKIYLGTNKGVFVMDTIGQILHQYSKADGLIDECIYALIPDATGTIWASTNKGIFRVDTLGRLKFLNKLDGLQENEFNTNVAAASDDGEYFFGGVNGVTSFYPEQIMGYKDSIALLVTGINVNERSLYEDTAYWAMETVELPYNQNSISLDFVAMGNVQPSQYNYQYRMKGLDDKWIDNGKSGHLRFFLPSGEYTLQLYASRSFDSEAIPIKEIKISILKPFWRTNFFFSIIGLIILGIAALFIQQFVKRKYMARVMELELIKQKKEERERISRDLHDSLGAYVNAVLYNVELLESSPDEAQQKDVLKDLKFVSKDIINSLRETVWAFKKDVYSAEECFIRLRGFIHSCSRYYAQIHFKVSGDVPEARMLTYSHALDLVRIVQEAITNAIRHAACTQIEIRSCLAAETWKLHIIDNGNGFDTENVEFGNGIKHMNQRASESSFLFRVISEKNIGTTIELTI